MSGTNTVAPAKSHKGLIIGGIIAGVIILGISGSTYNGLTRENELVNQSYAQVQNVYQRQADLIPNLVESVKGYASHEKDTFISTAQARAGDLKSGSAIDPATLANNPELQKKLVDAQVAMLASARSLVNVVSESNPTLRASEQFTTLTKELEGSQNRISIERRRNQQIVQEYNTMVHVFPRNIFAGIMGFTAKPYFTATEESQTVPKVKF